MADQLDIRHTNSQYQACRKRGLDVHIKDVRTVKPGDYGMFDAIVSVGAFEHFCSFEEYKEGKQEHIYSDFFQTTFNLLPSKGRFYLQTMTCGKNMIPIDHLDMHPKKGSDAFFIKLMADHGQGPLVQPRIINAKMQLVK